MHPILEHWRESALRPRTGFARFATEEPFFSVLVFPMASGAVQSFVQAGSNNMGAAYPLWMVLLGGCVIGGTWGLIQVHVISGLLWMVGRRHGTPAPFSRVRHVTSVASAPMVDMFLGWVVGALLFGSVLFIEPGSAGAGIGLIPALGIASLYFGTAFCLLWFMVLLVFGIRSLFVVSVGRAIGMLAESFILLAFGLGVVVVVIAFVGMALR